MRDQAARLRQLFTEGRHPPLPVPSPEKDARVIAVTSGKGGVGKTTLAVNLAVLLAEQSKVLILDADLGLANVDVMLGIEDGRHIGHLLLTDCLPEEVASDGPRGIKVISGGSGLSELADADEGERRRLLAKLRSYFNRFDYVLIDTSPGIGLDVVDFLREADDILLVTTVEPTSLRDTYAALKAIHREIGRVDPVLVVNQANRIQAENAMKAINQVAGRFLDKQYNIWSNVEADGLVARTIRERKPIMLAYPKSQASICVRRLAGVLASTAGAQKTHRETEYALV